MIKFYSWKPGQEPIVSNLPNENSNRVVRQSYKNGYLISTVFLGIDHNHIKGGQPILFETMIFKNGSWMDLYCCRYSTEQEAIEGHKEAEKWASKNLVNLNDILIDLDFND